MELSATEKSGRLAQSLNFGLDPFRVVRQLIMLLALTLTGCGDKPPPPAASAAPPVTVAQPTKRTVTDWDEFTGRFEAVEEVQVRARVGGFVTNVEFRDGAFVNTGDLLYVIDSRPFEA
ncbi:MAG: rane fusion protein multidrug efflux system, partial [Bradyrhizobium sp.]|nr:rane fusion protein multidrug efflux system [Bradyrhizobium sp.]